jgi:hypothetical protein
MGGGEGCGEWVGVWDVFLGLVWLDRWGREGRDDGLALVRLLGDVRQGGGVGGAVCELEGLVEGVRADLGAFVSAGGSNGK